MKYTILLIFTLSSFFTNAQETISFKKQIKAHRIEYKADFLKEERSPFYGNKKALKKMQFFKADEDYRVLCTFHSTPEAKPFDNPTYSGKTQEYVQYGTLYFTIKGKKYSLAVYKSMRLSNVEEYKNHLFLPFKDHTNDELTYGGGRYIDLESTDIKNNEILIDFNKCYNPWCAYSDGYNCPVPPIENHLEVAIEAGEKLYKGKH